MVTLDQLHQVLTFITVSLLIICVYEILIINFFHSTERIKRATSFQYIDQHHSWDELCFHIEQTSQSSVSAVAFASFLLLLICLFVYLSEDVILIACWAWLSEALPRVVKSVTALCMASSCRLVVSH